MRIRIQGDEKQCFEGIRKLKKNLQILKVSDFQPLRENPPIGRVYVEVGEFFVKE